MTSSRHSHRTRGALSGTPLALLLGLVLLAAPAAAVTVHVSPAERVSVTSAGGQAAGDSWAGSLSRNGRVVAFQSEAPGIVPGDTNGAADVFVRDRARGVTERVSLDEHGLQAGDVSAGGAVSADGRCVAFQSLAALTAGDANGVWDVYVRDRVASATVLVSAAGTAAGHGASYAAALSADGRLVAFVSSADDLVAGDTGGETDVFVRDLASDDTTRVSLGIGGAQADGPSSAPVLSADGRFVAFESVATNLVPDDTNGSWDVFVRDLSSGATTRVSTTTGGGQRNGDARGASLSADGRYVAFTSEADLAGLGTFGVTGVFVKDTLTGRTVRASSAEPLQADGPSDSAVMAPDGSAVAFRSLAGNLVPADNNGCWDVFLCELASLDTTLVSAGSDADSHYGGFSPDGRWLAFDSTSDDLVADDTNGASDVFVARVAPRTIDRIAGDDRFRTAVAASARAFPAGAPAVVVATGRNWPDALGGAALAGAAGGPVLLTEPGSLPEPVRDEIVRLHPATVYVLGDERAVAKGVADALAAIPGVTTVTRLKGDDRYGTSAAIADEAVRLAGSGWGGGVLVATGGNYPDALSASPAAFSRVMPVALVPAKATSVRLPAGATSAVVLGSEGAVPAAVETWLDTKLGDANVDRLKGDDRYGTSAAIAEWAAARGLSFDGVTLTTGTNYPDALAGGAMAGRLGSVMLLTRPAGLPGPAYTCLSTHAGEVDGMRVLGKTGSVADSVVSAALDALGDQR